MGRELPPRRLRNITGRISSHCLLALLFLLVSFSLVFENTSGEGGEVDTHNQHGSASDDHADDDGGLHQEHPYTFEEFYFTLLLAVIIWVGAHCLSPFLSSPTLFPLLSSSPSHVHVLSLSLSLFLCLSSFCLQRSRIFFVCFGGVSQRTGISCSLLLCRYWASLPRLRQSHQSLEKCVLSLFPAAYRWYLCTCRFSPSNVMM